jgi:uncharacterized protein (TIGR02391 family)
MEMAQAFLWYHCRATGERSTDIATIQKYFREATFAPPCSLEISEAAFSGRHGFVSDGTQFRVTQDANTWFEENPKLRPIIELFDEKLEEGEELPISKACRAFGDLDLHPENADACYKHFVNGHYADAVESSCKVLDILVKNRSKRKDLSGTPLMQLVFSQKSPILKFNEQQDESEKSEQLGMMYLFSGAMLAIRNPRAHGLVQDDPENAVAYISFISMLAKSLDRTRT